jgi:tRNA(fMet)-specific endonuclease VapC
VKYLLDTTAAISLFRGADSGVSQKIRLHPVDAVAISTIVLHELFYGAFNGSRVARSLEAVEALRLAWVEFDFEDARVSGEMRAYLSRQGTPIGPYDRLIAGQAKARGLILVTHNVREFSRIPGLLIEDWEAE